MMSTHAPPPTGERTGSVRGSGAAARAEETGGSPVDAPAPTGAWARWAGRWSHLGTLSWWILADALRSSWAQAVGSMVLSLMMTALQAGSFLLVAKYAGAASAGEAATLPLGLTIPPTGAGLLWVTAALVVGLSLGAVCQYAARAIAVRVAIRAETTAAARALRRIAGGRFGREVLPGGLPDDKSLIGLLTRGPRYLGRAMIELLETLPALAAALVALAWLASHTPLFTAGVLALLVLTIPAHLAVVGAGMAAGRELTEQAREDTLLKSGILDALRRRPVVLGDEDAWILPTLDAEPARRYLAAYSLRLRISHVSLLVSNLSIALIIAGLVLYFGRGLLWTREGAEPTGGVADLLVYLIALKVMLGGVSSAVKSFTSLNIFYIYFDRNLALIGHRRHAAPAPAPLSDDAWRALLADASRRCPDCAPSPDRPVMVVSRPPLTLLNVGSLYADLFGADDEGVASLVASTGLISGAFPDPSGGVRSAFALSDAFRVNAFIHRWPVFNRRIEGLRALELGRADADAPVQIPPAGRFVLALAAVLERPEIRIVIIDAARLATLKSVEIQAVREALADRCLILSYASVPKRMTIQRTGPMITMIGGRIAGLSRCEDFARDRDAIVEAFASERAVAFENAIGADFLEEA